MNNFIYIFVFVVLLVSSNLYSQDSFGYKLYGYVKTDVMLDTRQNAYAREGHVLLYPLNSNILNGEDANEGVNFNILSIQSRFGFSITAPEILGAKATGNLEGEYFGSTNNDVGSVRMRHGYVKLDWGSHELMAGHFWHPLFIEDCYAHTISFNTGIPFVAFGRNPLVKYTYKPGKFKIQLSAISERDFTSTGPGGESSNYLRNSGIPMTNLGVSYNDGTIYLASNLCYKELKPRLASEKGFKDDNRAKSLIANFLVRYKTEDFYITCSSLLGQNTYDLLMIGGYAVKSIDESTGIWEYTPVKVSSFWIDTDYGKELLFGFFGAFSKNLGCDDEIVGNFYSRGKDIDYIYRLSPRITYNFGKTQLASEFEYTVAAYGKPDKFGVVSDTKEVNNLRVLLSASIFF